MTGLCVADAPNESYWFILQDVSLRCRLWFLRDGDDSRVFPLWALLQKVRKRWILIISRSGKLVKNMSKYRKTLESKRLWNEVLNDAVRRSPGKRWRSCQTAHEGTFLSVICFFKGKIQPKTLYHSLKKQLLVMYFTFLGSIFLLFPRIWSDVTLFRFYFFKGFFCGFCSSSLFAHNTHW